MLCRALRAEVRGWSSWAWKALKLHASDNSAAYLVEMLRGVLLPRGFQ